MDSYYDIYSTGELVTDANPAETRAALARLFKTSEDKIAHLIAGKPQLIKRRVEKTEALRYKATLHQAGLLVSIKLADSAPAAITENPTTETRGSASPASQSNPNANPSISANIPTSTANSGNNQSGFTLAPAGSDLLHDNEKQHVEKREIDTSAIRLAPVSFLTETTTVSAPPAPDTRHLSLAEAGSFLGHSGEQPPQAVPDISHITVADVGASLDELKPDVILLNPDISSLSLAETGVDLIPAEYHKPAPPAPPSTEHIQLQPE